MRILLSLLLALAPVSACALNSQPHGHVAETPTRWEISGAEGLDALLLIGVVGGDVLQAGRFSDTVTFLREHLSPEGLEAIDEIDRRFRQERGLLTGPALALVFSAGPIGSLADVIASAENPETRLGPGLAASPYWDEENYAFAISMMPSVHTALIALQDVGYERWYASTNRPTIEHGIERIAEALAPYDLIPEQARLLGRPLDPTVGILVVRFNQPYGIRVIGQRFVAFYEWEAETQLRVAAHEIFHPPFDTDDEELLGLLSELEADPWMRSIVEDHDPQYGYNSFMGVINEGSTQALDQIVSARLGFARDPGARWRDSDGGMHMFAAAAWHAMTEDGFDESGGTYSDWLKSALRRGLLTPSEVRRRATEVVGEETVDQWGPHRAGATPGRL